MGWTLGGMREHEIRPRNIAGSRSEDEGIQGRLLDPDDDVCVMKVRANNSTSLLKNLSRWESER